MVDALDALVALPPGEPVALVGLVHQLLVLIARERARLPLIVVVLVVLAARERGHSNRDRLARYRARGHLHERLAVAREHDGDRLPGHRAGWEREFRHLFFMPPFLIDWRHASRRSRRRGAVARLRLRHGDGDRAARPLARGHGRIRDAAVGELELDRLARGGARGNLDRHLLHVGILLAKLDTLGAQPKEVGHFAMHDARPRRDPNFDGAEMAETAHRF